MNPVSLLPHLVLQERMKATIHSIWYKFEQTIKHRVEDILSGVNHMARSPQETE
jgi:hypothetical protein